MKLGIMQPYFFPYIGYWQLINAVDTYVIYDDVNFIKGGWINRNRILVNNEANMINLKMNGASPNKLINQIEVSSDRIYNKKLLKTIQENYKKASYFFNVYPVIENILNQDEKNLARYLEYSIQQICKYISIDTQLIISSSLSKNNVLEGQDKVIEICKVLEADEYLNAIGGRELYSHEDFASQGIKLKFLETRTVVYKQLNNEFIPNLSIIDVLMFNSREDIKKMLEKYKLL
jgi:hypothetical protein